MNKICYFSFCFILVINLIYTYINVFHEKSIEANTVTLPYKGKNYDFNLIIFKRKVFENVPIWTVESTPDGDAIYKYKGISKLDGILYDDIDQKAIFYQKNDCSGIQCWEGVFGFGSVRNVIHQRNSEEIYETYSTPNSERHQTTPRARTKNDESTLYLKLLLVIDHAYFIKLHSDMDEVTKYLSIFWPAVDLQYRNITSPKIEIRIAGVIIAKDDEALDFIGKNSPDGKSVNIDNVLRDSRIDKSFIKNTNITNNDGVMTITSLSGFFEPSPGFKYGSSGITYNGSICMEDYNFSVIGDDGSYFGIHNAIHEIGHFLGIEHDGEKGNSKQCRNPNKNTLTVMWGRMEDRKMVIWSECSVKSLKIFTSNNSASWCLRSEIHQHP